MKEKETRKQQNVPQAKPATHWLEESGLPPQEAHRVDPTADRANLQYSALYSGDIAVYRRRFGGQCVGLGPHQAIEWTDNRGSKVSKKRKESSTSRYFTSVLPQKDSCLYLGRKQEEKIGSTASKQSSHAPFFMAIETASLTTETDGEENGEQKLTSEVFVSQQTAWYNRALQEDPRNVGLWLEFLEHQPALQGKEGAGEDTLKSARALNERKLAIFERALEQNPKSEELLVAQLELLRDMDEEPQAVLKRWRDLVFRMPNKPLLWLKYTEFCRTQFSTFSVSSLTTLYHKGVSTLTSILEGVMKSHRPEANTTDHLLTLFSQFCHCLAAAGQNERAIACYQALIEFNLCCPPDVASTTASSQERAAFFEPFWDSGAPRLGEVGAVSWSQWLESTQHKHPTKPLSFLDTHFLPPHTHSDSGEEDGEDPEINLISGCSLPEAWVRLENYRQRNDSLPFRGSEDDLSDPERAVLFEDVSHTLLSVVEPHLQLQLVLQYLQFLGVELGQGGAPSLDNLPHLISTHLHCTACTTSPAGDSVLSDSSSDSPHSLYPHKFCGVGAGYTPLSTEDLLQQQSLGTAFGHPPLPPSLSQFITNTFNQVLSLLRQPQAQTTLALEWVRFELSLLAPALGDPARGKTKETRSRTKAVQKLVKSLLRHEAHRNNLALWDCCGQLEFALVGVREARGLYESVISQYTTITPPMLPLYQHYCQILMGLSVSGGGVTADSVSRALQLTVCVAEGKYREPAEVTPPGSLLKARHLYEQISASHDRTSSYKLCHVYFEYLSRGIDPACKVFDQLASDTHTAMQAHPSSPTDSKELRTLKTQLHTLYRHQVKLLLTHSQSKPMPPTLLWRSLECALADFPDDPFFLTVYTDSQQPLYLMGKLRKYFDCHAPKARTGLPWVHAVQAEVARYERVREGEMEGTTDVPAGLVNRIHALLNRAIQSVNGRGCPLLWRLAMSFEVICDCGKNVLLL